MPWIRQSNGSARKAQINAGLIPPRPGLEECDLDGSTYRDPLEALFEDLIAEGQKLPKRPDRLGIGHATIAIAEPIASGAAQDEIDGILVKLRLDPNAPRLSARYDVIDRHQQPMVVVVNETDAAIGAARFARQPLES